MKWEEMGGVEKSELNQSKLSLENGQRPLRAVVNRQGSLLRARIGRNGGKNSFSGVNA